MYTNPDLSGLWFDVGIKRYTTQEDNSSCDYGCGLMQESKDIQQAIIMY